ncbi:MAG: uroporphyrinogen decarboxylase family protein [Phycisphaerae bacterium]
MNDRERFHAVMNYGEFDRGIIQDFAYWHETVDVWHLYGLPRDVDRSNSEKFFGLDPFWHGIGARTMLWPPFETKTLEDDGTHVTYMESDGTILKKHKYMSSIPEHVGHTLTDRQSWEKHYKWRLDPTREDRIPEDIADALAANADAVRTWPLSTDAGSLFGRIRNWMGLLGVTYIQADDPELFEEMVSTVADCIVGTLERFLPMAAEAGVTFDRANMWEDMSCGTGPLMPLRSFNDLLVPQYKRISSLLRKHGCNYIMLDSDGDVRALIPGWLAGGVNITFPLEVGTWSQEPVSMREQFERDLRICGGFDKHILARSTDDIAREIDRLAPLVEQGGCVPFCDHRVPPDVPFENYLFYVQRAKEVWGKGLDNLRPTGKPDTSAPLYGQPYDYSRAVEMVNAGRQ